MTAPFGRRPGVVLERSVVGRYVVVRVGDPAGVSHPPRPGQFYMLAAGERWGAGAGGRPFLPRAFSVLDADGGELSFLLEDVGPGTRRLCQLEPDELIWLTGPLGAGFRLRGGPALIVGGGIGVAALLMLAGQLGASSSGALRPLLGFRDGAHAVAAGLFDRSLVATDDGSTGHHGLVTDLLAAELDRTAGARSSGGGDAATVYACGPPAMLEAVRGLCGRRAVAAQLALEAPMACGFGACHGCVVATRDGYRRVCVDGPVFDAAVLLAVA